LIYGIIPARFGSTRLPGKMLLEVEGKPVLQHTWSRASKATRLDRLVIAAGDQIIADAARSWGADVVEAFDECQSGSDRVWQAYRKMELRGDGCGLKIDDPRALGRKNAIESTSDDVVINIQGDEVQIFPETIDAVIEKLLSDPASGVGTAAAPIERYEDYTGDAVVKVVTDLLGRALYFSRAPIPSQVTLEKWDRMTPLRHIGIYAYRREVLELFTKLPACQLELTERLEQLRLVEQGIRYSVAVVEHAGVEINTAADLELVRSRGV